MNSKEPTRPAHIPHAWYYAGEMRRMARGPIKIEVGGERFVGFVTNGGKPTVLQGRCAHMGADLSLGHVSGGCICCPFHAWEFGADGRCVHIPAGGEIPGFAKQTAFPTVDRGGHVFFCNRPTAAFEPPFFEGRSAEQLLAAKPFVMDASLPWYMVGANGFDIQHFRAAHDRTLVGEPTVDAPNEFARTIRATFDVTGAGWRDRLTRAVSGPRVSMTITSWCGTTILVTADFGRTRSYGMVCVTPIRPRQSRLTTIVWVERSKAGLMRTLFDPLNAAVRRSFIRAFMRSDQDRSAGTEFSPATMIAADRMLGEYLAWLGVVAGGGPSFRSEGN